MSSPPLMSAAEYRVALHRLGLKAADAARIPGIDKRDSFRWYRDRDPVPVDVAQLLRFLVWAEVQPDELDAAIASMETPLDG